MRQLSVEIRVFMKHARPLYDLSVVKNDLLIAAIAVVNNLTLVTNNTREFSRVVDLQLDDWEI